MPRSTIFFVVLMGLFVVTDREGGAEPRTYGGKPAARWIQDLSHASPKSRAAAAKALAEVGGEEAVGPLLERLQDADDDTRLNAAYALGRIGKQPERTIAALIRLCQDRDEHVRYSAQWSLGQICANLRPPADASNEDQEPVRQLFIAAAKAVTESGAPQSIQLRVQAASEAIAKRAALPASGAPSALKVTPAITPIPKAGPVVKAASPDDLLSLIRDLRSNDAFVVMQGLARLKHLDPANLPLLMQSVAAGFQDSHLVDTLPGALAELGQLAAPALIDALAHGDESVRSLVADVVSKMGPGAGEMLPALTALLGDEAISDELREKAFAAVAALGKSAANSEPTLAQLVTDTNQREEFRVSAAITLGQIGPNASGAQSALTRVVRSEAEPGDLRIAAAEALAKVSPSSPETLQTFRQLLETADSDALRAALAGASGALGPLAAPLVPQLVVLIERGEIDDSQRQAIIQALAEIGPAAEAAIPALIRVLTESERATSVQVASAIALGRIGPAAVRALVEHAQHPEPAARMTIVRAIAEIGASAAPAVDCLLRTLTNEEEEDAIRTQAAIALSKIGAPARPAIPALTRMVADEGADERLRAMCAMAIGSIEPALSSFVAAALTDPSKHLQIAAAFTLHKLGSDGQRALSHLVSMLADQDDEIVDLAQQALADVGEDSISLLAAITKDKARDLGLRLRCVEALGQMGQEDGAPLPAGQIAVHPLLDALCDDELAETACMAFLNLGRSVIPTLLVAANDETRFAADARERIREVVRSYFEGLGAGPDELQWGLSRLQAGMAGESGQSGAGGRFFRLDSIGASGQRAGAAPPVPIGASGGSGAITPRATPKATGAAEIEPAIEAEGFKTVKVYYGTNRKPVGEEGPASSLPFSLPALLSLNSLAILAFVFCLACLMWQSPRSPFAITAVGAGLAILVGPQLPLPSLLRRHVFRAPSLSYGGERTDQVQLGVCDVTIPKIHQPGELETPSIFRLEINSDPEKHIIVRTVEPLNSEAFFNQLAGELGRKGRNILVFIHGYNVSFEDAARRTAQMADDLKFPGAALFYSWPSQANWYQYRLDERNVELSVEPLKTFLLDVAQRSGATTINLVAHSMGNRALTSALKEIDASASNRVALFNQVILAAPDIDATIFKQRIAPAIVTKARQITLYASSKDLALFASRQFNSGGPRAGDAGDELVLVPGVETIDASAGDCSLLGHSYYGSSVSVLRDIEHLLRNEPAKARPFLDPVPQGEMTYWLFHPPATAADPRQTEQLR